MHLHTAGFFIGLALLGAASHCAADAIDWDAMLVPGSVKYSGDVSLNNLQDLAPSAIWPCQICVSPVTECQGSQHIHHIYNGLFRQDAGTVAQSSC